MKLLPILLMFFLFIGACHAPQPKEPKDNSITEVAEVIKTKEQAEVVSSYQLQSLMNYVIVGSLAGIGVCTVIFLLKGSVGGILGGLGALVTLILALVIKVYMGILAILGLVVLVALVVIAAIYILRDKRAFYEVVETVEKAKEQIPDEIAKLKLKVAANALQHEATKDMVKKAKGEV